MSDLASTPALLKTSPQLPVDWYVDQRVYEIEQQLLFARGSNYIGHELMVPSAGDFHSLEWMNHAKTLVRSEQGVELLSNICRHRQAIMLKGRGQARNIVCPLHRWTYDMGGKLIGAPHFPGNLCLDLGKTPLQNWNGMLFTGERDVAQDLKNLGVMQDLDFSGYMLDRVMVDHYVHFHEFMRRHLEPHLGKR